MQNGVFITACLIVVALSGCGDDGPTDLPQNSPPASVTDLAAAAAGDSSITLAWNAPADPGKIASVASYDLRFSTSAITDGTWDGATPATGEPDPGEAGAGETVTVAGLSLGTEYFFALKSSDDKNEWSGLSNVAAAATDSVDDCLIAYWTLVNDSTDRTGGNDPLHLLRAPFENGGIYCSGLSLSDDGVNGYGAWSSTMESLDFSAFTIRARFQPEEYYQDKSRPVFVGGDLFRWFGYRLETDSTVTLMYNGGAVKTSTVRYTTGVWQVGTITYDGTTARLYLDDVLACEIAITLDHGENRNVSTTNNSSGNAFKGWISRLRVYDGVVTPGG